MLTMPTGVLTCPVCHRVLRKHAPNEGFCVFGHGFFSFDADNPEVIRDKRETKVQIFAVSR